MDNIKEKAWRNMDNIELKNMMIFCTCVPVRDMVPEILGLDFILEIDPRDGHGKNNEKMVNCGEYPLDRLFDDVNEVSLRDDKIMW